MPSDAHCVQEEEREEAADSEDEAGPANDDPALAQLMARPDGLQIMLRARKLVGHCCSLPASADLHVGLSGVSAR